MESKEDKEYSFVVAKSPTDLQHVTKKESELTQADLDLLFGHIIWEIDKLPAVLKKKLEAYLPTIINT